METLDDLIPPQDPAPLAGPTESAQVLAFLSASVIDALDAALSAAIMYSTQRLMEVSAAGLENMFRGIGIDEKALTPALEQIEQLYSYKSVINSCLQVFELIPEAKKQLVNLTSLIDDLIGNLELRVETLRRSLYFQQYSSKLTNKLNEQILRYVSLRQMLRGRQK